MSTKVVLRMRIYFGTTLLNSPNSFNYSLQKHNPGIYGVSAMFPQSKNNLCAFNNENQKLHTHPRIGDWLNKICDSHKIMNIFTFYLASKSENIQFKLNSLITKVQCHFCFLKMSMYSGSRIMGSQFDCSSFFFYIFSTFFSRI